MTEIQLRSGSSSSATHRLTQTSHALNRHEVGRPTNLAIEEAAERSDYRTTPSASSSTPSRLVNLRVHAADLARLAEQEEAAAEPASSTQGSIVPAIVELGTTEMYDTSTPDTTTESATAIPPAAPVNLTELVPQESSDDFETYSPAINRVPDTSIDVYQPNQTYAQDNPTDNYGLVQYSAPEASSTASADTTDTQSLAMSIAADYAAANFNASMATPSTTTPDSTPFSSNNSIDSIAQAASEAIAAIRTATDPEEVAEQVASLKAFADNIRATSAAPEMLELSDTIEKFIGVAMKSSKIQEEVERKVAAKQLEEVKAKATPLKTTVKKSSTATKRTATRPIAHATATRPRPVAAKAKPISRPTLKAAPKRTARNTPKSGLVADEEQALRKALHSVAAIDDTPAPQSKFRRSAVKKKTSGKRFALAFFCAIACVAGIVYFVGSNIPDISVKVAAMQTGIEASYPAYIPRDYSLSDISSEEGKITLVFKGPDKATFTLSEEKSSWDSTALLRNFVEPTWHDNYTTTHEQGITLYISGANAAWVNGGVMYKITASGNSLTKKQLRNIVTSM